MRAHKLKVTIPEDHQLDIEIRLPQDFPTGPAEVIVMPEPATRTIPDEPRQSLLAVIEDLRSRQRTKEEEEVLEEFDEFQREHPVSLRSLIE